MFKMICLKIISLFCLNLIILVSGVRYSSWRADNINHQALKLNSFMVRLDSISVPSIYDCNIKCALHPNCTGFATDIKDNIPHTCLLLRNQLNNNENTIDTSDYAYTFLMHDEISPAIVTETDITTSTLSASTTTFSSTETSTPSTTARQRSKNAAYRTAEPNTTTVPSTTTEPITVGTSTEQSITVTRAKRIIAGSITENSTTGTTTESSTIDTKTESSTLNTTTDPRTTNTTINSVSDVQKAPPSGVNSQMAIKVTAIDDFDVNNFIAFTSCKSTPFTVSIIKHNNASLKLQEVNGSFAFPEYKGNCVQAAFTLNSLLYLQNETNIWSVFNVKNQNGLLAPSELVASGLNNSRVAGGVTMATRISSDSILLKFANGTVTCVHGDEIVCQNCTVQSKNTPSSACISIARSLISNSSYYSSFNSIVGNDAKSLQLIYDDLIYDY